MIGLWGEPKRSRYSQESDYSMLLEVSERNLRTECLDNYISKQPIFKQATFIGEELCTLAPTQNKKPAIT